MSLSTRMYAGLAWPAAQLATHTESAGVQHPTRQSTCLPKIHLYSLSTRHLPVRLLYRLPQRARTDQPTHSPLPQQSMALSPQVQDTLRVLEASLAQHPHLLPLLYDIKGMLNTPGVEVAQVAPKIAALTSALQAAMAQQQQQPPQPQHLQAQAQQQQPPAR